MRVRTLASWGSILALTACGSNHSSPPVAEDTQPLEDEAIQVENQAQLEATITPSVTAPETGTRQSAGINESAPSPQLTRSRSSRASVSNGQTSKLLRARLERIRTQQAKVPDLSAPSPISSNPTVVQSETPRVNLPGPTTAVTSTSRVQPYVLPPASVHGSSTGLGAPVLSTASSANPSGRAQGQAHNLADTAELSRPDGGALSNGEPPQGEAQDLTARAPSSPQPPATIPAASQGQHLSRSPDLRLNPGSGLGATNPAADTNSVTDQVTEAGPNRHHLSGRPTELSVLTAAGSDPPGLDRVGGEGNIQPRPSSDPLVSEPIPTPVSPDPATQNPDISQTSGLSATNDLAPWTTPGLNNAIPAATRPQGSRHHQSPSSAQIQLTPAGQAPQPQFSRPAATPTHGQVGFAPSANLPETASEQVQKAEETAQVAPLTTAPPPSVRPASTAAPLPESHRPTLEPPPSSLPLSQEAPVQVERQSSSSPETLSSDPTDNAQDVATTGFSDKFRLDPTVFNLFPLEQALTAAEMLSFALPPTDQEKTHKTLTSDRCVPAIIDWVWLIQPGVNNGGKTLDQTSLLFDAGAKGLPPQAELFNPANTCPTGTRPLAHMMPAAATAGTPIPGDVESPTR